MFVCTGRGVGVGVAVGVGVGMDRGAIAELRRGRESWVRAAKTKLAPTRQVAAKTKAKTKKNCRRLDILGRLLVRFIINKTK